MPQLVNGGKWVYGWCLVNNALQIRIPPAAYEEYEFQDGEIALFIKGSKKSGGFGIARQPVVAAMPFFARIFSQGAIGENGIIKVPQSIECLPGEKLLAVRGSGIALSFVQNGPIYEEALKHDEVETFEVT